MSEPSTNPPEVPGAHEEQTSLPILRTWRAVYIVVTVVFIAYVVVLTILTRMYR